MAEENFAKSFLSQLLAQDSTNSDPQYREYREQLAGALITARRKERIAYWVCVVTGPISFGLSFVGGTRVLGGFDPWDKSSTPLSISLGTIYIVSSIVFWVLLASYYSRFRPRTRAAQDNLRDAQLLHLSSQLAALQKEVTALKTTGQ